MFVNLQKFFLLRAVIYLNGDTSKGLKTRFSKPETSLSLSKAVSDVIGDHSPDSLGPWLLYYPDSLKKKSGD